MRLGWVSKIIFFINILVGIGLFITNFSAKFDPINNSLGYLISLTYPFFLLFNLGFIFHWLYQKKIHFLFSLIIILFGYSNVSNLVAINFNEDVKETAQVKVMSFNVRLFNQFKWLDEEHIDDRIFEHIANENPDIVAFQEFIDSKKMNLNYAKRMKDLGYRFTQREPVRSTKNRFDFFGLQVFSKYKIKNSGIAFRLRDNSKVRSHFSDIEINNQTIRIYNTHLNSLGFISKDYQFVENITQNTESEAIQKSKSILTKVIKAGKIRQVEVLAILEHIAQSPYPVIVLGDFNEPPYSFAYPRFSSVLEDPFQKLAFGLGATFDGISTIPGLRLDYILHSPVLNAISYKTGPANLSDHRSVTCQLTLPK